jgi:branched-chain amino acid transport system ATP-binding protein
MRTLLSAQNLTGGYDGTRILSDCSIEVGSGEVAVIVGPNGAGKSTAMKAILGMIKLSSGSVIFQGEDVTSLPPQSRVVRGIAMVPQNHNVFTSLTVEENLEIGAHLRNDDLYASLEQVYGLFPVLKEKRGQIGGDLSGGQRQQLAVGRALMTQPDLLMLDEPTAGVSPIVMNEIFEQVLRIRDKGIGILIVEQNARQALSIADIGYLLINGKNSYTAKGDELLDNQDVRQSFIG